MNIQEAKTEIIRTFRAYKKRKADGSYRSPIEKQRPLVLIGPPGIGKTAVMEQIAKEEQIGLVSYPMTHHTRQSAVGLPLIREKEYGGQVYSATEYTMSEIIASVYDCMAKTGRKQGILFLDEINCVSETLSPVMLQLLQNKMFGTYAIPDGWVIAAAGNPPEYNKSVRELDMATLDRVKHMEIEADLSVWMDYAFAHGVHPSVTAYLTAHPEHFYQIQDTPKGQLFVTARGWEDLSCMMQAYEENGVPVQESLMIQYLQHDEIARSFYLFYDLFRYFGNAMAEQRTSTAQTEQKSYDCNRKHGNNNKYKDCSEQFRQPIRIMAYESGSRRHYPGTGRRLPSDGLRPAWGPSLEGTGHTGKRIKRSADLPKRFRELPYAVIPDDRKPPYRSENQKRKTID